MMVILTDSLFKMSNHSTLHQTPVYFTMNKHDDIRCVDFLILFLIYLQKKAFEINIAYLLFHIPLRFLIQDKACNKTKTIGYPVDLIMDID